MKRMSDTMTANLNDATGTEEEFIKAFDTLVAAKTKEMMPSPPSVSSVANCAGEGGPF